MADPYTNLADRLEEMLISLVEKQEISLNASGLILTTVNLELRNIQTSMEEQLQDRITSWEEAMEEEDKTLYSLGLRHALDIVTGIIPTDPQPTEKSDDDQENDQLSLN